MKMMKKDLMDIINKYDWLCSILLLTFVLFILQENVMIFYDTESSVIDNVISIFGTLFGFVLTCLSIFIVFKTDAKYTTENKDTIGLLMKNDKFNDIYILFLKDLYSIGITLLLSFTIYFIEHIILELKILFIITYMFFIGLSIIRTLLSLLAFQKLIEILIKNK